MKKIVLLCLLLLAPQGPITAETADPAALYTGEAVVADQDAGARARALPVALGQVLGKISGLPHFEDHPLVGPALERAQAILLSYHYRNVVLPGPGGGEFAERRLVARFSRPDVDELARALQLPVWRYDRPALVVWLVIDEIGERRIMPIEYADVTAAMTDIAAGRGLPVEWPQPVPQSAPQPGAESGPEAGPGQEYAVDPQLLWGGYVEDLTTPDGKGVMIVAARREGTQWGVRINLAYGGRQWAWRLQDIDLHAALMAAMHQAVDEVAAANTIAAADLGSWERDLTVAGLGGADDYQRCLAYLQGLGVVAGVSVVSARPGVATFRLALRALPRHLEESLAAGGVLTWVESAGRYRLVEAGPDEG